MRRIANIVAYKARSQTGVYFGIIISNHLRAVVGQNRIAKSEIPACALPSRTGDPDGFRMFENLQPSAGKLTHRDRTTEISIEPTRDRRVIGNIDAQCWLIAAGRHASISVVTRG